MNNDARLFPDLFRCFIDLVKSGFRFVQMFTKIVIFRKLTYCLNTKNDLFLRLNK
jgi:hypothetical protein